MVRLFSFPGKWVGALVAGCFLSMAGLQTTLAQASLSIGVSTGVDEVVSCDKKYNVEHTGAGTIHGTWYVPYTNNEVDDAPDGQDPFFFQAFCWDGTEPGYGWRIRNNGTTLRYDCDDLPEGAIDPDIAVGTGTDNIPCSETDGRGYGDFFMVITYELSGNIHIRIVKVTNPYANLGLVPMTSQMIVDEIVEEGHTPNVDVSRDNEFGVTYQSKGVIRGVLGKLYTEPLGGFTHVVTTCNNGNRRTSLDLINTTSLSSCLLAGSPFTVAAPAGKIAYRQPDIAVGNYYANGAGGIGNSQVFFTFVEDAPTSADPYKIQLATTQLSDPITLPTMTVPAVYHSSFDLQLPRIAGNANAGTYLPEFIVVFAENQPACETCEMGRDIPAHTIIQSIAGYGSSITHTNFALCSIGATHIDQCVTRNVNTAPVVASNAISERAAVLWQHDDPSNTTNSNLIDTDILGHLVDENGRHQTNTYFTNPGRHWRVNNNNTGDQIAPSVASKGYARVVTAWYDADRKSIMAHDDAVAPGAGNNYRQAHGPAPTPASMIKNEASIGQLDIMPNPTGIGGLLSLTLTANERLTNVVITEINTGKVIMQAAGDQLPKALTTGNHVQVPLQKLLPANLRRGFYAVKLTTTQRTYTSRLAYEPTEK